jgi:tetratricopeptide (TPR) repeat protein
MRAHEQITSLRFDEARVTIDSIRQEDPENLIPIVLENYIDFLTIIVGEDENEFERLEEVQSDRIKLLKKGDETSPWYRSCIAQVYLQWAFARVRFGEYFTAGREIRKAFLILEENQAEYPGFLPDKVGLGIMHALIGTIPDNYRWIANLFSMGGSVELGRSELIEALDRAWDEGYPYLEGEALFFLSFLELNLQPDRMRSVELLPYYGKESGNNLMLVFSKAKILMQTGHNNEAIELLLNRPRGDEYYPFYYLDFLTGLAKLNRLDEDANSFFLRFTTNFKGDAYVKEAYQKLAWYWLLNDDVEKYKTCMKKVILYGDDFSDGDKLALADAKSGDIPNTCLLRSRLLYDGGYYTKADSALKLMDCPLISPRDSAEYTYRRGRIYHSMGLKDDAITWYDKTIDESRDLPYYFAANAALQAGTIYEAGGHLETAYDYYRKCLRMPNTEYRRSLQQKAKAGLNRVRDKQKGK